MIKELTYKIEDFNEALMSALWHGGHSNLLWLVDNDADKWQAHIVAWLAEHDLLTLSPTSVTLADMENKEYIND